MKKPNTFSPQKKILGTVKRHPDGYGFFISEVAGMSDVYIPKHSMDGVMSNDRVEITVKRDGGRSRGEVVKIVERSTKKISGQFHKINSTQGFLKDESFAWGEDLKVNWPLNLSPNDKDWVVAKILNYPDSIRGFQGQIESIIGDISDPVNDNIRVLGLHNIPHIFSKKVIEESGRYSTRVEDKDMQGRKNLKQKGFVTIDGKTAKDFDDAVYVEKLPNGFRLWVAIADVSHYVKKNTAIDNEAWERGTSVYFPNFVAPMLPEVLSNELCSLKPGVPRLSLVAEMDFDFLGEMKNSKFYEAVIESHARVTYGEAQEVIDGTPPEKLKHVKDYIKLAGELAQILMNKRYRDGSLNLEIPESTIELDDSGVPVDIIKSERLFAHKLIEELMLAANVAVAKFLHNKNLQALYRVHEPPREEALATLERFLEVFGYRKRLGTSQLQKRITQALQEFQNRPEETVMNILALRSMNQARYSPENLGHFGLGFDFYAHFTSPIRRYPDLIIHRLLKAALGIKGYQQMSFADLEGAGTMLSGCEQRSVKAERQIQAIKKARFLEKYLGQEFSGIISSVARFGVFVTLRQFDVDGLVKLEELGGDRFEFDEDNLRLVGRKSGQMYSIGDSITIQVAAADHQLGRVDFVLSKREEDSDAKPTQAKPHKERNPVENNRRNSYKIRVSGRARKDESSSRRPSGKANPRRHK